MKFTRATISAEMTADMTGTLVIRRLATDDIDELYALPLAHDVSIETGDTIRFSPEPLPAGLVELSFVGTR